MDGLLLVDKPKGWTSFDVVAKIRGILARHQSSVISHQSSSQKTGDRRQATPSAKPKVGHTGTLDPLATGLLVIVLGSYCKRAQEFSKLDKVYEVEMTLGATSTTGDAEGTITPQKCNAIMPWHDSVTLLTEVMQKFVGDIMQTPPIYSAIKIDGQRAYKLARAGKEVKLEPRPVKIYEITDVKYDYPLVKFTTKVSSGTYIRSLVEDIGKVLGCGAYMSNLRRTQVGQFNLNDATAVENLNIEILDSRLETLPEQEN